MRFTTREDIGVDAQSVFASLSDFPAFERAALRRGADITRLDRLVEPGVGMNWSGTIPWRGRSRRFLGELSHFQPHEGLSWRAETGGFQVDLAITLLALSRSRTRLAVDMEIRPATLAARLKLQAVRLQKARLLTRFRKRVRDFADGVERQGQVPAAR